MSKYREPWKMGGTAGVKRFISEQDGQYIVLHDEIRNRISQCVNACAGMDDPVEEVERLKILLLDSLTDQVDTSKLQEAVDAYSAAGFTTKTDYSDFPAGHPAHIKFTPEKSINLDFSLGDRHVIAENIGITENGILTNRLDLYDDNGNLKSKNDAILINGETVTIKDEFGNDIAVFGSVNSEKWYELGVLPPVGAECYFSSVGHHQGLIWGKYHGKLADNEGLIVEYKSISCPECTCVTSFDPALTKFHPIQTEKQKIIKEMLCYFDGFFNGDGDNVGQVCEKIYDQFIAKKGD